MKIDNRTLALMVVLFIVCIVVVAALVALGKEASTVVSLITIAIIPTITMVVIGDKVNKTADKVEKVQHQTNGNMSRILAIAERYAPDEAAGERERLTQLGYDLPDPRTAIENAEPATH